MFKFHKWSYIIIEVPVFKYIVIDMLQVFVPLTLLAIIGLLIFSTENGIYSSGYNVLTYRLVNVASLMVAYVSLFPVIRESMPPMPGVTLVELIIYVETLPNLLAIISSLLDNSIATTVWLATYTVWKDTLFVISFALTVINLIIFTAIIVVYMFKEYTVS